MIGEWQSDNKKWTWNWWNILFIFILYFFFLSKDIKTFVICWLLILLTSLQVSIFVRVFLFCFFFFIFAKEIKTQFVGVLYKFSVEHWKHEFMLMHGLFTLHICKICVCICVCLVVESCECVPLSWQRYNIYMTIQKECVKSDLTTMKMKWKATLWKKRHRM